MYTSKIGGQNVTSETGYVYVGQGLAGHRNRWCRIVCSCNSWLPKDAQSTGDTIAVLSEVAIRSPLQTD